MSEIHLKRVYEEPTAADGRRVLVERLWPRGLSKDRAKVDVWLKAIAPSAELRKWFDHDLEKWVEFCERYHSELEKNASALEELERLIAEGDVTLVYAARDEQHNGALALKDFLDRRRGHSRRHASAQEAD
jgi:uncharacterized protein YeaO (DUF488 family)